MLKFPHNWGKSFTLAPFCRSISAIAFPIPTAAPVTAAILPFNAISAAVREDRESCVACRKYDSAESREVRPPIRRKYRAYRNMFREKNKQV